MSPNYDQSLITFKKKRLLVDGTTTAAAQNRSNQRGSFVDHLAVIWILIGRSKQMSLIVISPAGSVLFSLIGLCDIGYGFPTSNKWFSI